MEQAAKAATTIETPFGPLVLTVNSTGTAQVRTADAATMTVNRIEYSGRFDFARQNDGQWIISSWYGFSMRRAGRTIGDASMAARRKVIATITPIVQRTLDEHPDLVKAGAQQYLRQRIEGNEYNINSVMQRVHAWQQENAEYARQIAELE